MSVMERPSGPLRLRAKDPEDLSILSAALQDAIVPVVDMAYLQNDRSFVMVVNRFKWEDVPAGPNGHAVNGHADGGHAAGGNGAGGNGSAEPAYQRINCGVTFTGIKAVHRRGVDPRRRDEFLSLLAIEPADGAVRLVFAGGGEIRLELEGDGEARMDCRMQDIGNPWPTAWRPEHPFEEAGDTP